MLPVTIIVMLICLSTAHDSVRPRGSFFLEFGDAGAWAPRYFEQGHHRFAAHPEEQHPSEHDAHHSEGAGGEDGDAHALAPSPQPVAVASPAPGAKSHGSRSGHGHVEHRGHGEAEGHGHGHGHGHREETVSGRVLSFTLIGAVAFAMNLFYLVNHKDEDIRLITWKILDMTVSIFCAVMMYGCVEAAMHAVFQHPSETVRVLLALLLFLAFYSLVQFLLYMFQTDKMKLRAAGTLLAHATGFSALHCFAQLQALPPFNTNIFTVSLVVVIAVVTIIVLEVIADMARIRVALADDGKIDDAEMQWMEQVEETENDVLAFCVGFLLMQVCRYSISGAIRIYDPHEAPAGRTQTAANLMLCCGIFFALATLLSTIVSRKVLHSDFGRSLRKDGVRSRYIKISTTVLGMAMAWCFLFWADWQLYAFGFDGARIMACMLEALCLTLLSFFLIFALDYGADYGVLPPKALRSVISALGLLVGFSWERSFHIALSDVGALGARFGLPPGIGLHCAALLLVLVVLPAWYYYILPNSEEPEDIDQDPSFRARGISSHRRETMLTPRSPSSMTPPTPTMPLDTPAQQDAEASSGAMVAMVAAEAVGTCVFVFASCALKTIWQRDWCFIALAGIFVVLVYATGLVSYGHLNPAVSLTFAVSKRLQWTAAGACVVAQMLGGVAGAVACSACIRFAFQDDDLWLRVAPAPGYGWWQAATVEVSYTALLCFVALNSAGLSRKRPSWGLAIGMVLLAAGHGANAVSGGFLNPALTVAAGLVRGQQPILWAVVYCGHQLLGAAVAAALFAVVRPGELGRQAVHVFGVPLPAIVAEACGTFFLVLTVGFNLVARPFLLALSGSAAFVALACSVFDISGSHFNPAVTLTALSVGKIQGLYLCQPMRGLFYVVAQLFAAILGAAISALVSAADHRQVDLGVWGLWPAAAEIVFTCSTCIAAVVFMVKPSPPESSVFLIGKCMLFALFLSAAINPAVTVAIHAVHGYKHGIHHVIAELVGACIAIVLLALTIPLWHSRAAQSIEPNKPREVQVWREESKTVLVHAPREVPVNRQESREVPSIPATEVRVVDRRPQALDAHVPQTVVSVPPTALPEAQQPHRASGVGYLNAADPSTPFFSTRSAPPSLPARFLSQRSS